MKRYANAFPLKAALVLALMLAVPGLAEAHRFWLLPSSTVLSGDGDWITVDAARSNDMFYFNHNAMGLNGLRVKTPDGGGAEPANRFTGELRSVFDLRIEQQGTYKIAVVDDGLFARYRIDGEHRRWFGTADEFATDIPDDAEELRASERINRAETFVTAGAPTREVFEPTGRGLELVPETHPNDLYAGETARFRLLVDGEPAAGVDVTVVPGGARYRDDPGTMKFVTDDEGMVELTWPHAGMYWLEAGVSDDRVSSEYAAQRRLTYVATLEVLPL
ncbi:hypothetical protein PC39_08014 [Salinisphaera sp. PC39]|uniref:DUF4198 domain-containing protein n=1 Tax=Salinisphaera sp. PC39 TaxID=1304156 RepID=UPI00333F27BA